MTGLPVVPLLSMLFFLPFHTLAQQDGAAPSRDPVAEELSHSLRRVADALERFLESQRADVELKLIEVASRVLQLHWEQIALLRSAAETANEEALKSEQQRQLSLAELDILDERERELRATPENEDNSGERRERIRGLREERLQLESYIEQERDRAWRMREQANVYQSEMAEMRSRVAHLEAVIARWLEDLE